MVYKWCIVPHCTNTSIKTPEKMFVSIPKDRKMRKKWLILARRNPQDIGANTNAFMCEDHFNMAQDMANYTQYKMGFSQTIFMVKGAVPSKFDCQKDRRNRLSDTTLSRTAYMKRLKISEETQAAADKPVISTLKDDNDMPETAVEIIEPLRIYSEKGMSTEPIVSVGKQVQATFKVFHRSKAVQTKITTRDISLSPHKVPTTSTETSPFKIKTDHLRRPSLSGQVTNIKKKISFLNKEESDSDVSSFTETVMSKDSSFVTPSSSMISDSDTNVTETNVDIEKLQCLKTTMHLITKKPLMYVGIPKDCYFIIQLIHKHTNIPIEHILLCLKKIRLNSTFSELEDNFGLSLPYCSKLFDKNIPKIASVLRPFLVKLNKYSTLNTLPIAFRHNYYNVSCIIDCLEIDIQKPSKALHQALTWSDYKKGNTIKYLVSCTPNGLINYISPGFGGRTSDVAIIENCNFFETLEPGSFVLADRGFKHVEQVLARKGIKLLKPPSVPAGSKLSKQEVRQTKIIASLRIHVERVIRRIREFRMLKQHAVINTKILRVINDCIIIAGALINLQDSLIK